MPKITPIISNMEIIKIATSMISHMTIHMISKIYIIFWRNQKILYTCDYEVWGKKIEEKDEE